jgi:hypothetical protein
MQSFASGFLGGIHTRMGLRKILEVMCDKTKESIPQAVTS